MASEYVGKRDIKKEHYEMGALLTEKKMVEILKENFRNRVGYELNLENPRTFNEKVMWSKLYYQDPLITKCCDKFAVKEYVRDTIGEEYFVPNLGQWSDPEDIDFDALPDRFVLKVNWSSGYNIIVTDKSKLNIPETRATLKRWIRPERNSYYQFFNWGYKHMKPVIYAEEYLEQINGQVYDYKFFTFSGEVKTLFIATDRTTDAPLNFDFFDREYNHLPLTYGGTHHADPLPAKPKHYDKMIELAEKLAKPFPFVRVDFFEVGDRIYLGEMTFYSGGGLLSFEPIDWDYQFGEWYQLPEKRITDREGLLQPVKVAAAMVKYTMKKALRKVGRAICRHDKVRKKHFVTLFGFLRFPISVFTLEGWRYASVNGLQIKFKRAKEKALTSNPNFVAAPEFEAMPPYMAYMMEDKITYETKKHYIEQKAYKQLKYFPNLDNPKSFNEKLLWLALNYKNPHHAVASDKARAKQWVSERVGSEYVVPLLGAYDNVNDIDFKALPDKFVMKANEGWGADEVIIVRDKSSVDIDRLRANASSWLYPWSSYYYNNMCITDEKPEKPMVVFEELLEDGDKQYLDDYKFYCCNGEMKFALIVTERGSKDQTRTFVDADWNVLPVRRAGKFSGTAPKKPENLEKMLELARILCKEVPLARIDFYNLNGRIYVGEMTFTPGLFLRFEPKEWDFKLGEYLDISGLMKEAKEGKN